MSYQFDYYLRHGKVFLDISDASSNKNELGLTYHCNLISKLLNLLARIGIGQGTIKIQNENNEIRRVSIKDVKNLVLSEPTKNPKEIQNLKTGDILPCLYEFYHKKKIIILTAKANQGDGEASFELGLIHPSRKFAVDYFQRAAAAGVHKADAFLQIGKIYESDDSELPRSLEKAREYYQKALNEGSKEAETRLTDIEKIIKSRSEREKYLKEVWSPPPPSTQKLTVTDWEEIVVCNTQDLKQEFIEALKATNLHQTPFSQIIVFQNEGYRSDIFFDEHDGILRKYSHLVTKKQKGKCLVILVPTDKLAENRYLDPITIPSLPQPLFQEFLKNQNPHFYTLTLQDQKILKQKKLPDDLVHYIF